MKTLLCLAFMASTSLGCAVRFADPPPPPLPPPSAPQMMNYEEAVQLGSDYAQSRGYQYNLKHAHLTGNRVWKLQFAVYRGEGRGKLHLDYDAFSRQLLKVDEKLHPGHGHGDDDDDDDEGHEDHGHGRKWTDREKD